MNKFVWEHKHDFSLYLRCLNCNIWGIPVPDKHYDGAPCGNCGALETVAYYPKCCIFNVKLIHMLKEQEE
jgi:hypothetical protein